MKKKNFTAWHKIKKDIEQCTKVPLFREREIWWCSIGINVGFEEDGKNANFERPILVLRKFNREMFWGISLSSKNKTGMYYHTLQLHQKEATVLLSQMKTISSKRLIRRIGKITDVQYNEIKKKVIDIIKKTDPRKGPQVPNGNI